MKNCLFLNLIFFHQLFLYKIPCFHSSIGDLFIESQVVAIGVDCLQDISEFDYLCEKDKKSKDLKMGTSPSFDCFQSIIEVEVRSNSTTF
jgi:hypothetical protein